MLNKIRAVLYPGASAVATEGIMGRALRLSLAYVPLPFPSFPMILPAARQNVP